MTAGRKNPGPGREGAFDRVVFCTTAGTCSGFPWSLVRLEPIWLLSLSTSSLPPRLNAQGGSFGVLPIGNLVCKAVGRLNLSS